MNLYTYRIKKVEKVVDGDTVYVTVDTGFYGSMYVKVRLANLDTPELNSPIEEERQEGKRFKRIVEAWFKSIETTKENMFLVSKKQGKYGRWIGEIYATNIYSNSNALSSLNGYIREKLAEVQQ